MSNASRRASSSGDQPAAPRSRFSRLPWAAIVLTALVVAAATTPRSPIRDAATLGAVPEARLDRSPAYVLLSPVTETLDALTLLTVPQHVVVLLTAALLFAGWRVVRRLLRRRDGLTVPGARGELARVALFLVAFFGTYGFGALVPRPMARLVIEEADVIAVDVHAHTEHSHDGRRGWSAEDVRAWQRGAGFHAAYIADHRTYAGAQRGLARNPVRAGEDVLLLPAIEVVWRGAHVNILSAGTRYNGLTNASMRDMDEEALGMVSAIAGAEPVIVHTVPGNLDQLTPATGAGTAGARAIEIVDGAPRGLRQARRERARILQLAADHDLALVAGSNNHGWGRTAAGWTLVRIPQWRGGSTEGIAYAVEGALRAGGRASTRVVERVVADLGEGPAIAATAPAVFWTMLTTLTLEERVAWIGWIWTLVAITWSLRRRRRATPAA